MGKTQTLVSFVQKYHTVFLDLWVSNMHCGVYVWIGGGGGVVMEHLSSCEAFLSSRNAFF